MNFREIKTPVLIVDDESEVLEVVQYAIGKLGLQVHAETSGEAGIAFLKQNKCFLVISDYRMAGMNGLEFAKGVKQFDPSVPFILLTGYADKEMAIESVKVGVDDFLEKPFTEADLEKILKKFSEQRLKQLEAEHREIEEITQTFLQDAAELLSDIDQQILRLEANPPDPVVIDLLFRKIHSIKGGAGVVAGGQVLADLSHQFESILSRLRKGQLVPNQGMIDGFLATADLLKQLFSAIKQKGEPDSALKESVTAQIAILDAMKRQVEAGGAVVVPVSNPVAVARPLDEPHDEDEGVQVSNEKLDSFMKLSGELVVLKNHFNMIVRDAEIRTNSSKFEKKMNDFIYSMSRITDSLQDQIMDIRRVSLHRALAKLPRIVRQTTQELKKKVEFKTVGFELSVDKTIAKALSVSLTHMVRNSVDHGLETPDVRGEKNKSPVGLLTVSAKEVSGTVQVLVEDDGQGIDPEKVLNSALSKGLIDESKAKSLSEEEIYDLIFLPGLSTSVKVSSVSGRGVGMDVVRSSVTALGGKVQVRSQKGKGTAFVLTIPVPKSVMVEQTVVASSNKMMLAVPLKSISRISPVREVESTRIGDNWTCQFEESTIRLVDYRNLVAGFSGEIVLDQKRGSIIVLREKRKFVGLIVDSIHGQFEAVVRPFDNVVKAIPGFKGTTVLGDDSIAYVLSAAEVVNLSSKKAGDA